MRTKIFNFASKAANNILGAAVIGGGMGIITPLLLNKLYDFSCVLRGEWSLTKKLDVATTESQDAAPKRAEFIKEIDQLIAHSENTHKETQQQIKETKELLTEWRTSKK